MAEPPASPLSPPEAYPLEVFPAEFRPLADDTLEWETELAAGAERDLDAELGWDLAEEVTNLETPPVPPLELAGSLSRAASLALFGHV
jgi:hypothetical protein